MFLKIKKLFGTKLLFLFAGVIATGIAVGLVEVVFGLALQNFLSVFGLIGTSSTVLPFASHPTALLIIMTALQSVTNFFNTTGPHISIEVFNARIRDRLARRTLGQDNSSTSLSVAEMSHLLTNLIPKVAIFVGAANQGLGTGFIILILLTGMAMISVQLTGIALGIMVVLISPVLFLKNTFQKYISQIHLNTQNFILRMVKNLRNIYFLMITGTAHHEMNRVLLLNQSIVRNSVRYILGTTLNSTLPLFAGVFIIIALVLANAHSHFVSDVLIVPLVYYFIRLSQSASRMATAVGQIQLGAPFFRDILENSAWYDESQTSPASKRVPEMQGPLTKLVLKGLSVGRESALLPDIELTMKAGDFLLVSGKSGKGKTTFLMTLIGILPGLKGHVEWNDVSLDHLHLHALRKHIGYSGSDPFLFDGTIRENLLYGLEKAELSDENIQKALEMAQCSFVFSLPNQLDHMLKEGGEGISAGQKQRLSIARAILRSPSVLMFDEATSSIDETTETLIFSSLRKHFPTALVLAVSHRNSLRELATLTIDM